jgi:hypothetical protein
MWLIEHWVVIIKKKGPFTTKIVVWLQFLPDDWILDLFVNMPVSELNSFLLPPSTRDKGVSS